MRCWILYFIIGISVQSSKGKVGTYVASGFEWESTLALQENGEFTYFYSVSGCQGKVTGSYQLDSGKSIRFILDEEYTSEFLKQQKEKYKVLNETNGTELPFFDLMPCYPNLNEGNWKFVGKGIKMRSKMKCSCLSAKGLFHKKMKR